MEQQQLFKVRDKRNKGWFWVENEYFNGFGKIMGVYAIGVYVCLCRHADNDQKCFPAQKTIAEELKIGVRKIRDIIKDFEKYHIIEITKERSLQGKWLNNVYWLTDKTEWIKPEAPGADGKPEAPQDTARGTTGHSQRHPVPTNNTHKNNTNKKNTNIAKQSFAGLNDLIELFKPVNPSYERLFANTTQRAILERLVKKMGQEKLKEILSILSKINKTPYAPTITTPLQLENKLGDLIAFLQKERSKLPTITKINKDGTID